LTEALEAHLRRQIEHSRQFFWHRLRWQTVRRYLPPNLSFDLVDVGAGAGLLGYYLERDRPLATYRFIEPIDTLRTSLRGRYGKDADIGGKLDFGAARFVTLLDVLEHQEDDQAFLKDTVEKMQPKSTLLVTVPALQKLWSHWDDALGHFRRYDKSMLLKCTEELPLAVREIDYLFPEMVPLAMFRARDGASGRGGSKTDDAEFPDLPAIVNDLLYGLGSVSMAFRRHWKTGTSLFMAATVTG